MSIGAVELEEIPFDPEELLTTLPKSFQYPFLSKGIEITVNNHGLPRVLWGDTMRLTQILNNIISNAIKFTEKGGITIEAGYKSGELNLTISDSGIGMTESQLDKVFESFEQADKSTTRQYGGTGLGLSIVKEILVLMNATYEVKSQAGVGTTFIFNIPLRMGNPKDLIPSQKAKEQEYSQKDPISPLSSDSLEQRQVVLVVDDNEINRNLMVKILERMNITPLTADSGTAAINTLQENSDIKLVFMDYHMPGLNGIEATKIIMDKLSSPPPIIALTADVLPDTAKECRGVGMKELLAKPIQRSELKRVLRSYLNLEG